MFVSIFFPKNAALVTTSLYLIGIIVAIFVALFITRSQNSYSTSPFIIELPSILCLQLASCLKILGINQKDF
ncbi:hypothetical protein Q5M85_15985 [Paraclostridium bifermentans]|nr:hypothetical protein [Paraclostridium bifermentans]